MVFCLLVRSKDIQQWIELLHSIVFHWGDSHIHWLEWQQRVIRNHPASSSENLLFPQRPFQATALDRGCGSVAPSIAATHKIYWALGLYLNPRRCPYRFQTLHFILHHHARSTMAVKDSRHCYSYILYVTCALGIDLKIWMTNRKCRFWLRTNSRQEHITSHQSMIYRQVFRYRFFVFMSKWVFFF
jgi:hypothetical protein